MIGICQEAGIVFQTNSTGSVYYVNGNPIDISYSYSNSSSNSAGSQSYNISIKDRDDVYAYLGDDALAPAAIYYMKSTRPAMNVGSRAALELTFTLTVTSTVFIADALGHIKRIICGRTLKP